MINYTFNIYFFEYILDLVDCVYLFYVNNAHNHYKYFDGIAFSRKHEVLSCKRNFIPWLTFESKTSSTTL